MDYIILLSTLVWIIPMLICWTIEVLIHDKYGDRPYSLCYMFLGTFPIINIGVAIGFFMSNSYDHIKMRNHFLGKFKLPNYNLSQESLAAKDFARVVRDEEIERINNEYTETIKRIKDNDKGNR